MANTWMVQAQNDVELLKALREASTVKGGKQPLSEDAAKMLYDLQITDALLHVVTSGLMRVEERDGQTIFVRA